MIQGLACLGETGDQTMHIRVDMKVETDVVSISKENNPDGGVIVNRDVVRMGQRNNNNHGDVGSMCQRTKTHQKRVIMVVHRDLMSMSQRNNHRKWFIIVHNVSDQHGENRLFDLPEGQTGHLKVELNQIDSL
jgi:hypothetical protein